MLVLSDLHGACSVRSLALKFIVENGKEIVAQNGWRDKLKVKDFSIFYLNKIKLLPLKWFQFQMYPEIMADMFEAMTKLPSSKRQRLS